ncbi:MAG: hypothetical protein JF886_11305 [Candidatus Dormibacteraeota bacterium]|uniref:Alpha/beta hydrolase n=1 Tax=Candidatus Aeolococcus gillhamiae TaxID=3127015 RepID=A0A934JY30_9BACT|nr:hypothetical protein [Candidatus Dormibacteraeota bacterium]
MSALMVDRYEGALAAAHDAATNVIILDPERRRTRVSAVVLHMRGISVLETAAEWRPTTDDGVLAAIVESTLRDGDGAPCWDDDELAARDASRAAAQLSGMAGDSPLVLAGGSQGAGHAIRLAIDGSIPGVIGFLAIVGVTRLELISSQLPAAAARGLRGYMVAGQRDTSVLGPGFRS